MGVARHRRASTIVEIGPLFSRGKTADLAPDIAANHQDSRVIGGHGPGCRWQRGEIGADVELDRLRRRPTGSLMAIVATGHEHHPPRLPRIRGDHQARSGGCSFVVRQREQRDQRSRVVQDDVVADEEQKLPLRRRRGGLEALRPVSALRVTHDPPRFRKVAPQKIVRDRCVVAAVGRQHEDDPGCSRDLLALKRL